MAAPPSDSSSDDASDGVSDSDSGSGSDADIGRSSEDVLAAGHDRVDREDRRPASASSADATDASDASDTDDDTEDDSEDDSDLQYSDLDVDDDDDEDSDEEEDHWEQYREVDAADDNDRDDLDAAVPADRYALDADVRAAAAPAAGAPVPGLDDDDDEAAALQRQLQQEARQERELAAARRAADGDEPAVLPDGSRVPLRDIYEAQLDEYAERMSGLNKAMDPKGEGRGMSRQRRAAMLESASRKEELQIPGVPDTLTKITDRGPQQLEALTASGEWCLTIVDVKMTTTQTAQGKKSRFSAMVMVGNLSGKGGYGIGVSKDANAALFKAIRFAILGAINIPLYRGHTVYYASKTKFVRTKISIFPRPTDFGVTASPIVTEACELLGLQNVTVKTHNSRNVRNVVKGFFQALANIPTAAEFAEAKGVYMREGLSADLYRRSPFS